MHALTGAVSYTIPILLRSPTITYHSRAVKDSASYSERNT
jgi:hypothetical protein